MTLLGFPGESHMFTVQHITRRIARLGSGSAMGGDVRHVTGRCWGMLGDVGAVLAAPCGLVLYSKATRTQVSATWLIQTGIGNGPLTPSNRQARFGAHDAVLTPAEKFASLRDESIEIAAQ